MKPYILVVEDEAALLTLLRYNLEKGGFEVGEAVDGEEALLMVDERRPDLTREMLAPMNPVEIQVRDGDTVYGYVTSPETAEKPGRMVVMVHGGPHGIRDFWGFNTQVQLLASRGYHVLNVNVRGSGGYGRSYMRKGFGEWGALMQDDVTDATRWAIDTGIGGA